MGRYVWISDDDVEALRHVDNNDIEEKEARAANRIVDAYDNAPATSLSAKAAAWESMSTALDNNAKGDLSAADVTGVGFGIQERLARKEHERG